MNNAEDDDDKYFDDDILGNCIEFETQVLSQMPRNNCESNNAFKKGPATSSKENFRKPNEKNIEKSTVENVIESELQELKSNNRKLKDDDLSKQGEVIFLYIWFVIVYKTYFVL